MAHCNKRYLYLLVALCGLVFIHNRLVYFEPPTDNSEATSRDARDIQSNAEIPLKTMQKPTTPKITTRPTPKPTPTLIPDDQCVEFREAHGYNYTLDHYVRSVHDAKTVSAVDVTLVTNAGLNRLNLSLNVVDTWKGPIVAVVWCSEEEETDAKNMIDAALNGTKSTLVDVVLALYVPFNTSLMFPHNIVRNIGIRTVKTSHMLIIDGDFILPASAHPTVLKHLQQQSGKHKYLSRNNSALVIPAFETELPDLVHHLPDNKDEMLAALKFEITRVVKVKVFLRGHSQTNYKRWYKAKAPYRVRFKEQYEPYIVIRTDASPLYNESFLSYGYDKASYCLELDVLGFQFYVLHDVFMIHQPHETSIDRPQFINQSTLYSKCTRALIKKFNVEMRRKKAEKKKAG